MTGPSLADIWDRRAGTVEGFTRYSDALKQAQVVWDEAGLDAWLADPQALIPENRMIFRGLPEAGDRSDLIAHLRQASEQGGSQQAHSGSEGMAGGGMMGPSEPLDLKTLEANNRVASIRHCRDTYTVVTEDGGANEFWEFNLRFKTDGGENGPAADHPVIIPGGMMGDRAFVVFASPAEISPFIRPGC